MYLLDLRHKLPFVLIRERPQGLEIKISLIVIFTVYQPYLRHFVHLLLYK